MCLPCRWLLPSHWHLISRPMLVRLEACLQTSEKSINSSSRCVEVFYTPFNDPISLYLPSKLYIPRKQIPIFLRHRQLEERSDVLQGMLNSKQLLFILLLALCIGHIWDRISRRPPTGSPKRTAREIMHERRLVVQCGHSSRWLRNHHFLLEIHVSSQMC